MYLWGSWRCLRFYIGGDLDILPNSSVAINDLTWPLIAYDKHPIKRILIRMTVVPAHLNRTERLTKCETRLCV